MSAMNITLREVRMDDMELLFAWLNDYELRINGAPYRPVSWPEHVNWVTQRLTKGAETFFIIALNDQAIGTVNLSESGPVHRGADFSIRIGDEKYRGKGYGTEALQQLINHCWKDLNLHRLSLTVFSDNYQAIRSYEKAGFSGEGTLREAAFIGGMWKNLSIMSVINPHH